jgi:spore germination cell wall hydrolase CwlJ-like protein
VTQRARAHVLASPFGTIHAATFKFPQPLGTAIPEPPAYQLASLVPSDADLTGALSRTVPGRAVRRPLEFPTVNRRLKGDLLVPRVRPEPEPAAPRDLTPGRVKTVSFPRPADVSRALEPDGTDPGMQPDELTGTPHAGLPLTEGAPVADGATQTYTPASLPPPGAAREDTSQSLPDPIDDSNPAVRLGRLYFDDRPVGDDIGPIEPWPAGEELTVVLPAVDPDIKRSALEPAEPALPPKDGGQTVAPKGEVTGPNQRPRTPAERLGLAGKPRAKAEKCLAEAVYFESRGEVKRGQIAVAQVVMNRVFSGFYPNDVCGVVYQNAHRKLACQFTFACDNVKDVVNEPDMWEQAIEIARDTLDGKLWLADIGYSTHYHAYWVHPWWARSMRKLSKIGVHTFYRPRAWGDTVEVPNYTFVPPAGAKL